MKIYALISYEWGGPVINFDIYFQFSQLIPHYGAPFGHISQENYSPVLHGQLRFDLVSQRHYDTEILNIILKHLLSVLVYMDQIGKHPYYTYELAFL